MILPLETTERQLPNGGYTHTPMSSLILPWPAQTEDHSPTAIAAPSLLCTYISHAHYSVHLLSELKRLRDESEHRCWPGAERPRDVAFDDAEGFVDQLPMLMEWMPDVGLADDGEVNFLWESDAEQIDLGFYGTGTYSYFARDRSGDEYFGDDIPVVGELPGPLTKLLSP